MWVMLASNEVYGVWPLLLGLLIGVGVLAVVSLISSARGHWSGPVLALPAILIGGLLFIPVLLGAVRDFMSWNLLFVLPLIASVASFTLYVRARKKLRC